MTEYKMTNSDNACAEYLSNLERWGKLQIAVVWTKSKTWGNCPAIYDHRENKIYSVSGCGYDKHSAVLAGCLKWLYPHGSDEYLKISSESGVGVESVTRVLKELGYTLTRVYYGVNEVGYTLTKD